VRPTSPSWTADYLTADRTWTPSSPTVADVGHPGWPSHSSRSWPACWRPRRSSVTRTGSGSDRFGVSAGEGKATTKCASVRERSAGQSGTYLRQGLIGGSNVRFSRGNRSFRHITRARDHRDVPRDAAESLRRSHPFPRPRHAELLARTHVLPSLVVAGGRLSSNCNPPPISH
jgi:hypothetical protein